MILFTHIPKTAGRSLSAGFLQSFGDKAITVDAPVVLKNLLRDRGDAWRQQLQYVGGHVTRTEMADLLQVDFKQHFPIALLRDPVRRVVSHYLFILRNDVPPMEFLRKQFVGKDLEYFVDVCAERLPYIIVNTQTRYLSGAYGDAASAIAAIETDYALVAHMNRFQEFHGRVREATGNRIPEWSEGQSWNIAPRATTRDEIALGRMPNDISEVAPAHVIRKIEKLSEADLELLEYLSTEHNDLYVSGTHRNAIDAAAVGA